MTGGPTDSTIYLLQKVAHKALAQLEQALGDLDVTARQFIVLALASGPEQPSQSEIAAKIGVDATVLGRMLDDLEQRTLLHRRRAPGDRRRHELALTPPGQVLLAEAERRRRSAEHAFLGGLTAAERTTLTDALARLL